MANNPKKVKDPTEVALSAIQEALNIGDSASSDTERDATRNDAAHTDSMRSDAPPPIAPPPIYNDPSFEIRDTRSSAQERPAFDPIEEPRQTRSAANDDRETIGQILQAIQKGRPARSTFTLAGLFAVVWVVGALLLTIAFL